MPRHHVRWPLAAVLLLTAGCGAPTSTSDSGTPDAGDAGTPRTDAGAPDAGSRQDAGLAVDAGARPICRSYNGSLTIGSLEDWQSFVDAGCLRVADELTITTSGVRELVPPATQLTSIGTLRITTNDALQRVQAFPALHDVGELDLQNNPKLTFASFPALTRIVGDLSVTDEPVLADLELPILSSTGPFSLFIFQNDGLTTLTFPVLPSVGDNLALAFLPALTSASFPALKAVPGSFIVLNVDGLVTLDVPLLASAGGISVVGDDSLPTVSMPSLTTVGTGGLSTSVNNVMTSLDFPALVTVNGPLTIKLNPLLRQCVADGVKAQLTAGPTTFDFTGNTGTPNVCP